MNLPDRDTPAPIVEVGHREAAPDRTDHSVARHAATEVGSTYPLPDLYGHRFSGFAAGMRLYLIPLLAGAAGLAMAGSASLLCASFVLAALAGWLATYSP